MQEDEIKKKIKGFTSKFLKTRGLKDGEDLFKSRAVNSMFSLQLIQFVEKEFNISITRKDLDIKNFNSVNAIYSLIRKKLDNL